MRPIGQGRTGHVYLAQDTLLERPVAVKFIPVLDADALPRFLTEARAAARIQHPNVATLYRAGQFEGHPYLVSEYIRGTSLDRLARPQPWQRVLEIGVGLARGLAAAHRRNVLHRDIKPGNAILEDTGTVKLLDFGLAKLLDVPVALAEGPAGVDGVGLSEELASPGALELPSLTPGTLVGTPYFMSPEAWAAQPSTARADLFSLGAVLYELAAGRGPFRHVPPRSLARVVQEQQARPLAEVRPDVDARLAAVVDRCLRRDPLERFASADALLEALEDVRASEHLLEVPEGNPYRGLHAFQEQHRALFFGRQREVRAVVERLRANPFVLVTGDSGVGKSSLCLAGVIPRVMEGALEDGFSWRSARMVPGRRPLATLASVLAPHFPIAEARLAQLAREEPTALVRALRAQGCGEQTRQGLLLHVDQLEELVTLSEPGEALLMAEFLAQLASGLPGMRLLATVRSDFLTRLGVLPGLGEALSRALYLLRPLGREEIREVITGPVRLKGARFESEALITALVDSTLSAEGGLPLLQFTLAELWEARDVERGLLSAASLEALGGVNGALARYADGIIAQLLPDQRMAARRLLMRLVTVDNTRARRSEAELLGREPAAPAALEALIRARLVVARRSEEGSSFDIAHEALLTGWPTLAQWLAEAQEARQFHARLEQASAEWERLGRAREALWGARQLAELQAHPDEVLSEREQRFLEASRLALRRGRLIARTLGVGFVASLVLVYAGVRVNAWHTLERQVTARLEEARVQGAQARQRGEALERSRTETLALFDAGRFAEANPRWSQTLRLQREADLALGQVGDTLERALMLDPTRAEVREAFAQVLAERAELAERAFRTEDRDELLQRLRLHDTQGTWLARWTTPMRLRVHTEPEGATVSLARYDTVDDQRVLSPVRELGPTPVEAPPLERGTWMLEARAPGRVPVRYPLRAEPGTELTLDLFLPEVERVPEGFVYVPAGAFLFGTAADENVRQFFNTTPLHTLHTGPFLIARTEVTYVEYLRWLEALPAAERALRSPHGASATSVNAEVALTRSPQGRWHLRIMPNVVAYEADEGQPIHYTQRPREVAQDWRRMPVGAINFEDAKAYTAWLASTGQVPGARLCSELEWERAARGADAREFPQGDVLLPTQANFDETYGKVGANFGPDEVGRHPESQSPFGLEDMAGNVFEWVDSALEAGRPVARSGSYYYASSTARIPNRETPEPNFRDLSVGLRVCASAPLPVK
ncbi:nSTAND1 domain-containing NTPase [Melittangium boletus]|uniref:nSTAND1 domain-containing NTPase n=1 Tax=Melittangium boletus TaxID=83453 RepID=UPI003DA3991E